MTKNEHEREMNNLAEEYIGKLSKQDEIINDLRYRLKQFEVATAALGWLIQEAQRTAKNEP